MYENYNETLISLEGLKTAQEVKLYYMETISRLRKIDSQFDKVVERELTFEQILTIYQDMFWFLDGDYDRSQAFHDNETSLNYPKCPAVILKYGEGLRFLSQRIGSYEKNSGEINFVVDKEKASATFYNLGACRNGENQVLCCIDSNELFEAYRAIGKLESLEFNKNIEFTKELGISKEIFESLVRGSHSWISIPKDKDIAQELFSEFKLVKNCDAMRVTFDDNPKTEIGIGQIGLYQEQNLIRYKGNSRNNGMISTHWDGVTIPENNPKYWNWAMNWVEEIFKTSREFNSHAVFKNRIQDRFIVTVDFKI